MTQAVSPLAPSLATQDIPSAPPRHLAPLFANAGLFRIEDLGFDASGENSTASIAKADDTASIYNIPGERVGHISYGYEGERWRIRSLVWVVAQSTTGQKLVETAYHDGYRIAFDSMSNAREEAMASINPGDKVIILDSRTSPTLTTCMLIHQLALANAAIAGIDYSSDMTPPAALIANRMASTYAASLLIQTAYELRTSETLPKGTNREAYWQEITPLFKPYMDAFCRAAVNDMALAQGTAMASALREMYKTPSFLEKYDINVVNYYRSLPPGIFKDAKAMTEKFDPTSVAYRLALPCMVYAMTHDPKLDLTSPSCTATSVTVADAVASMQQLRRAAGIKDRDPWQIMVADI